MCVEELESASSLESLAACRLIPLGKKPGLQIVDVWEVLRWKAGKAVIMSFKNGITYAAGASQLSAGQDEWAEAVVYAMHDIFSKENTEDILLFDAENAFNCTNWKVMFHNMKFLCPLIFTYMKLLNIESTDDPGFISQLTCILI